MPLTDLFKDGEAIFLPEGNALSSHIFSLRLPYEVVNELQKQAGSKSPDLFIEIGSKCDLLYKSKKFPINVLKEGSRVDIFKSLADAQNTLEYMGKVSHKLTVLNTHKDATTSVLKSQVKTIKQSKEAQKATLLESLPSKSHLTSKVNSGFSFSRSVPSSPAFPSQSLQPRSRTLVASPKLSASLNSLSMRFLHLLALGPASIKTLAHRTGSSIDDIIPLISDFAQKCSSDEPIKKSMSQLDVEYILSPEYYKHLRVWDWKRYSKVERQNVIADCKKAFDLLHYPPEHAARRMLIDPRLRPSSASSNSFASPSSDSVASPLSLSSAYNDKDLLDSNSTSREASPALSTSSNSRHKSKALPTIQNESGKSSKNSTATTHNKSSLASVSKPKSIASRSSKIISSEYVHSSDESDSTKQESEENEESEEIQPNHSFMSQTDIKSTSAKSSLSKSKAPVKIKPKSKTNDISIENKKDPNSIPQPRSASASPSKNLKVPHPPRQARALSNPPDIPSKASPSLVSANSVRVKKRKLYPDSIPEAGNTSSSIDGKSRTLKSDTSDSNSSFPCTSTPNIDSDASVDSTPSTPRFIPSNTSLSPVTTKESTSDSPNSSVRNHLSQRNKRSKIANDTTSKRESTPTPYSFSSSISNSKEKISVNKSIERAITPGIDNGKKSDNDDSIKNNNHNSLNVNDNVNNTKHNNIDGKATSVSPPLHKATSALRQRVNKIKKQSQSSKLKSRDLIGYKMENGALYDSDSSHSINSLKSINEDMDTDTSCEVDINNENNNAYYDIDTASAKSLSENSSDELSIRNLDDLFDLAKKFQNVYAEYESLYKSVDKKIKARTSARYRISILQKEGSFPLLEPNQTFANVIESEKFKPKLKQFDVKTQKMLNMFTKENESKFQQQKAKVLGLHNKLSGWRKKIWETYSDYPSLNDNC